MISTRLASLACALSALAIAYGCAPSPDDGGNGGPLGAAGGGGSGGSVGPWSNRYGGTELLEVMGVAVDSEGSVVLAGDFSGSVDFGGGPLVSAGMRDVYVAKLDANGQHLWSRRFGHMDSQSVSGLAVDAAGNVILSGSLGFGTYIIKLDPDGAHLWTNNVLAGAPTPEVAIDSAGNVLLAGYFQDTLDFGGGPLLSSGDWDVYVAKLAASGAHLFSKPLQRDRHVLTALGATPTGDFLLGGYIPSTNDFGELQYTVWIHKLDARGLLVWAHGYLDWNNYFYGWPDRVNAVSADATGNVVLVGEFYGKLNFGGSYLEQMETAATFAVKLDAGGSHVWSQQFGKDYGAAVRAHGAAVGSAGELVLAGGFYDSVDFGGGTLFSAGPADIFVAALDAGGAHSWSQRFGDASSSSNTGPQQASAVAIDPAGNIIVAGEFHGTVDFGTGPLVSSGDDIFVAKLVH